jgi:hypothetical protein
MKRASTVVLLTLLFGITLSAVAQMEMPKPGPELKKLDYFLGNWTMEGNMKPGPMGPGGKWSGTEHDEWMQGGYFLVSHSDYKGAPTSGVGLAIMGYDTNDKVYTYDAFNSMGEAEHSKGTLTGDTWTWTSDEKMGSETMKGRFTLKMTSSTTYDMKFEMSMDGTTWSTVMEGKGTKSK